MNNNFNDENEEQADLSSFDNISTISDRMTINDLEHLITTNHTSGNTVGIVFQQPYSTDQNFMDVSMVISPPNPSAMAVDSHLEDITHYTPKQLEDLVVEGSKHFSSRLFFRRTIADGRNSLQPIAFLEQGIKLAKAVGLVAVNGSIDQPSTGTGFLISEDVLLTCNHVLPDKDVASDSLIFFDYQQTVSGELVNDPHNAETKEYFRLRPDYFFHTSPKFTGLDYTLVQVDGKPGSKYGFIQLPELDEATKFKDGWDVFIIGHPNGRPKEIAVSDNDILWHNDQVIVYEADTETKMSGSPVFNDSWDLIGLHYRSFDEYSPTASQGRYGNQAIRISAIREDILKSNIVI